MCPAQASTWEKKIISRDPLLNMISNTRMEKKKCKAINSFNFNLRNEDSYDEYLLQKITDVEDKI